MTKLVIRVSKWKTAQLVESDPVLPVR